MQRGETREEAGASEQDKASSIAHARRDGVQKNARESKASEASAGRAECGTVLGSSAELIEQCEA